MPWNTVDMLTMLPRAAEAGDIAGREVASQRHAMDEAAASVQQNVEQKAQAPVETQQSETEQYDMDQGSGGRGGGASQRRRKKEKEKDEAPMAPKSNSMFDIMI